MLEILYPYYFSFHHRHAHSPFSFYLSVEIERQLFYYCFSSPDGKSIDLITVVLSRNKYISAKLLRFVDTYHVLYANEVYGELFLFGFMEILALPD